MTQLTFERIECVGDVPNAIVVEMSGAIDALTAAEEQEVFCRLRDAGYSRFVLAVHNIKYMNETGLDYLVGLAQDLELRRGCLVWVGLHPKVRVVFDMIGLTQTCRMEKSEADALAYLRTLPPPPGPPPTLLGPTALVHAELVNGIPSAAVLVPLEDIGVVAAVGIRDVVGKLRSGGASRFVVDLSRVSEVRKAGLDFFTSIAHECAERKLEVLVAAPSKKVEAGLRSCGFDNLFRFCGTREEAVGILRAGGGHRGR